MSIAIEPVTSDPPRKWYRGLERYCWIVLVVAGLGWLFDTMDQNLYNLVRAPSLGVGGEWAAGAALVAETFPARSRSMALGFLQSLSAVGNMVACVITLVMPNLEVNWRWAYVLGAAPALLVLWIRRSVREPQA